METTVEVVKTMRADTQRIGQLGFEMTRLVADVEKQAASLTEDKEPKRRRAADRVLGIVAPLTDKERSKLLKPKSAKSATAVADRADRADLIKKVREMRKAGATYQAIDKKMGHGDTGGWSWRLLNAKKDGGGRKRSGRA
jgi:hypothetical protein